MSYALVTIYPASGWPLAWPGAFAILFGLSLFAKLSSLFQKDFLRYPIARWFHF